MEALATECGPHRLVTGPQWAGSEPMDVDGDMAGTDPCCGFDTQHNFVIQIDEDDEPMGAAPRYPNGEGAIAGASQMQAITSQVEVPPSTRDSTTPETGLGASLAAGQRHTPVLGTAGQAGADALLEWTLASEVEAAWRGCAHEEGAEGKLGLSAVGRVLGALAIAGARRSPGEREPRPLPPWWMPRSSKPVLLVLPRSAWLPHLLAIYHVEGHPLPRPHEVLQCGAATSLEDVELFWRRARLDPMGLYVMLGADELDYGVAEKSERVRQRLGPASWCERVAVFVAAAHSYMGTAYAESRVEPPVADTSAMLPWLRRCDGSGVQLVASERCGMGKSLRVRRFSTECGRVKVPLLHQKVNLPVLLAALPSRPPGAPRRVVHIDISPFCCQGVEALALGLLLGELTDGDQVWRREASDLVLLEWTGRPAQLNGLAVLPQVWCKAPRAAVEDGDGMAVDRQEMRRWAETAQLLERHAAGQPLEFKTDYARVKDPLGRVALLRVLLQHCQADPSWAEVATFANFVGKQCEAARNSVFCNPEVVGDTLPGFKAFVLRFALEMARDFTTPALLSDESGEAFAAHVLRRTWEQQAHPYLFFNKDGQSMTFLGLRFDGAGSLLDVAGEVLVPQLVPPDLLQGLLEQGVDVFTPFEALTRDSKLRRICAVLGVPEFDPDPSYELTTDNVQKMLAVAMRFRCGIPVVLMGETGCGKTRLVHFLSALLAGPEGLESGAPKNLELLRVHGGTSDGDVAELVRRACLRAQSLNGTDTILFLDEANTSTAVAIVKEVMCDGTLNGRDLQELLTVQPGGPGGARSRLHLVAAVNPYRRMGADAVQRLSAQGLGYHVASGHTEHFGDVPLRELVYRVNAMPPTLRLYAWDFGKLSEESEAAYIRQIVHRQYGDARAGQSLATVLVEAQRWMRAHPTRVPWSVSLRDTERTLVAMDWFFDRWDVLQPRMAEIESQTDRTSAMNDACALQVPPDTNVEASHPRKKRKGGAELAEAGAGQAKRARRRHRRRHARDRPDNEEDQDGHLCGAAALALGLCYCGALEEDQEDFCRTVGAVLRSQLLPPPAADEQVGADAEPYILHQMRLCQEAFIAELAPTLAAQHLAPNRALRENLWAMAMCAELRIPLFMLGKPGSSKSLARAVLADAMQGLGSASGLFQELKQAQLVSFQCSPLSTAEGIVQTFRQCARFQEGKDLDAFVSVVVLDEVGLAEDSPTMALKALHGLLEDGRASATEASSPHRKVGFLGISNWALDPAKMSRGLVWLRGTPSQDELVRTAQGIAPPGAFPRLQPVLAGLAMGYLAVQRKMESLGMGDWFGLRDFYALCKMLVKRAVTQHSAGASDSIQWQDLELALRRNFGGSALAEAEVLGIFRDCVVLPATSVHAGEDDVRGAASTSPQLGGTIPLIQQALAPGNQGRYLLVLTETMAAAGLVQQLAPRNSQMLFGSAFPRDHSYSGVCRNLNRIKLCMEAGRPVVLFQLDSLYESLYDALNQFHVVFGGHRYVDLGLGSQRVKCRMHPDFQLVIVAEQQTALQRLPIPLLNRLEKHRLSVQSALPPRLQRVAARLRDFARAFGAVAAPTPERGWLRHHVPFAGYQEDAAASLVLQAEAMAGEAAPPEELWRQSRRLLLQLATADGVARLPFTPLAPSAADLQRDRLLDGAGVGLAALLRAHLPPPPSAAPPLDGGAPAPPLSPSAAQREPEQRERRLPTVVRMLQVSTAGRLLAADEADGVGAAVGWAPTLLSLQQFQTEDQFAQAVQRFLRGAPAGTPACLLVQCQDAGRASELVACAKHCIQGVVDAFEASATEQQRSARAVVLLLQVAVLRGAGEEAAAAEASAFAWACGQGSGHRWVCYHVDELVAHGGPLEVADMSGRTPTEAIDRDFLGLLALCWVPACSRLREHAASPHAARGARRIELWRVLSGDASFLRALRERVMALVREAEASMQEPRLWLSRVALSLRLLRESGSLRAAGLCRLQRLLEPVLAEVLSRADRNANLEALASAGGSAAPLRVWWIGVLSDPKLLALKYEDLLSPADRALKPLNQMVSDGFTCRLPWSWLLRDSLEAQWRCAARGDPRVLAALWGASAWARLLGEAERAVAAEEPEDEDEEGAGAGRPGAAMEAEDEAAAEGEEAAQPLDEDAGADSGMGLDADVDMVAPLPPADGLVAAWSAAYCHDLVRMEHRPAFEPPSAAAELELAAVQGWVMQVAASRTIPAVHAAWRIVQPRAVAVAQLWAAGAAVGWGTEVLLPPPSSASRGMVPDLYAVTQAVGLLRAQGPHGSPIWNAAVAPPAAAAALWLRAARAVRPALQRVIAASGDGGATTGLNFEAENLWPVDVAMLWLEQDLGSRWLPDLHAVLGGEQVGCKGEAFQRMVQLLCRVQEDAGSGGFASDLEDCPLCLERLSSAAHPAALPCLHIFCASCIKVLLGEGVSACPQCRKPIPRGYHPAAPHRVEAGAAIAARRRLQHRLTGFFLGYVAGLPHLHDDVAELLIQFGLGICVPIALRQFQDACLDSLPAVRAWLLRAVASRAPAVFERGTGEVRSTTLLQDGPLLDCFEAGVRLRVSAHLQAGSSAAAEAAMSEAKLLCGQPGVVPGLRRVAALRVGLTYAASALHERVNAAGCGVGAEGDSRLVALSGDLPLVREVCQGLDPWPRRYLGKCVLREAGVEALMRVARGLPWAVPPEVREERGLDVLAVLGARYEEACRSLALHGPSREGSGPMTALALYAAAVAGSDVAGSDVARQSLTSREDACCSALAAWLGGPAGTGGGTSSSSSSSGGTAPGPLHGLVALWAVCLSISGLPLLAPLHRLWKQPGEMLGAFLPAMPDDAFVVLRGAVRDATAWYQCPNGHRFAIGDCGQAMLTARCNECGAPIGGQNHRLLAENRAADAQPALPHDAGHLLQPAGDRARQGPAGERGLGSAEGTLASLYLHATMLLAGDDVYPLLRRLPAGVAPTQYLWEQLEADRGLLARAMGCSEDDALLVAAQAAAVALQHQTARTADWERGATNFGTKELRGAWEAEFQRQLAQPALRAAAAEMDSWRRSALQSSAAILSLGDGPAQDREAALWQHRQSVSLESAALAAELAPRPALALFLRAVPQLRVLQWLPDVARLVRGLERRFHARLSFAEARAATLAGLLQEDADARAELAPLFESFAHAWRAALPSAEVRARWPGLPWGTEVGLDIPLASVLSGRRQVVAQVESSASQRFANAAALLDSMVDVQNRVLSQIRNVAFGFGADVDQPALAPDSAVPGDLCIPVDDTLGHMLAATYGVLEPGKYYLEALELQVLQSFVRGRRRLHAFRNDMLYREDCSQARQLEALRAAIPQQEPAPGLALAALSDADLAAGARSAEVLLGILASAPAVPCGAKLAELLARLRVPPLPAALGVAAGDCEARHLEALWRALRLESATRQAAAGLPAFDLPPPGGPGGGGEWDARLGPEQAAALAAAAQQPPLPPGEGEGAAPPLPRLLAALWALLAEVAQGGLEAAPSWPLGDTLAARLSQDGQAALDGAGAATRALQGLTLGHGAAVFVEWARLHTAGRQA